jgi:hypothetical protein
LFWIIIWLMPAAVVSVVEGTDRVQRDVSDINDRLVQTARSSAADAENVLTSGEQVLRTLANQAEVRAGAPDCGKSLANAIKGLNYFTNIARIDATGQVLCSAVPPPPKQGNVSDQPWWASAMQHSGFFITPQIYSVVSHRNVLGGVLPLRTGVEFDGAMALALDVAWLDILLHSRSLPAGAVVAVFDPVGTIVASNNPEAAEKIFVQAPQSAKGNERLSADANGESWSYVLLPLRSNATKVGFAMRNRDLFASTYLHVTTDLLLPVLMLGLASAAIWIFADRQITRWIVYLRRIATAYARGHYAIRPVALEEAPSEFRTLGETFSAMATAVQDRDRHAKR